MQKKNFLYVYLASASALWIYLALRAWFMPPVHDEAATFFHYINHGEYWPGQALWDANNHIVNSFLSKYIIKIFGISTFTIRLANLLFFPVYAWFLYRLALLLHTPRARFLLLMMGLCIHGFVEYFAYSRGYGMSMAVLTGALYYSYRFFAEKRVLFLPPALFLYTFGTLCNLTLQNSTLLFMGLAALFLAVERFTVKQRLAGYASILVALLPMAVFVGLSLKMKKDGLLYNAGGEDFWTAVITSYTRMYFDSSALGLKLFWFFWTGILLWLTVDFLLKFKQNWATEKARWLFPLLFFGNVAALFPMHFLMDVNYPSDRTGMYLILYLFLACVFLADVGKPLQQTFVFIPALIFFVQFSLGANLSYSNYWKNERISPRLWQRVYDESQSGAYYTNPTVGGYRIRNLVWAWHNFGHGGVLQNMQYPDYCSGFEEYQLFSPGDYSLFNHLYDSLDTDEYSGVLLARRKQAIATTLYWDTTGIQTPENYTGEYQNLFETLETDSFINRAWLLEADIKLYSLVTPPKVHLVTSFFDAAGHTLNYQTSPLHWLRKEFRPEQEAVTLKLWWYNVPPETKRIIVYLWNVDGDAYTLQNANVRLYKAQKDF